MYKLTVSSRGQVKLPAGALRHLGVRPGGRIDIDLQPRRNALLSAVNPTGSIDKFIGMLAGKTKKVATIDEIKRATAHGWAGQPQ